MIVVLKQNSDKERVERLMQHFTDMGLRINYSEGEDTTILGLMGDTTRLDEGDIMAYDVVERVQRVTEPFKAVNRKFHPEDTIIEVAGRKIGAGYFNVMAGPCSVENEAQIVECAERVKAAGASFLRGGAFKPRTSPYSFQGLEAEGLKLLLEAKRQTGLPIVHTPRKWMGRVLPHSCLGMSDRISTKVAASGAYISSTEGWNTMLHPCSSSSAQSRSKSRG